VELRHSLLGRALASMSKGTGSKMDYQERSQKKIGL
jgi:hypothetical protein